MLLNSYHSALFYWCWGNRNIAPKKSGRVWSNWVTELHKSTADIYNHNKARHNKTTRMFCGTLQWRHDERDGVSNHRPYDCFLNRLFRLRSKQTSKLRVNGLCEGNSPVTGEFPAQRASSAENVSIWWRHHVFCTWRVVSITIGTNTLKLEENHKKSVHYHQSDQLR